MQQFVPVDVIICGAGAAGLTLALDLARRGVAFRLLEQRDTPFNGSRGKGIQPRTQELLEDLGVLDRVVAAGGFYPPQRVHQADGSHVDSAVAEVGAATPAEPYALPLMVPQFLTEATLRERLAELGYRPEFGNAVVGFVQDDEGVTVEVEGPAGRSMQRARYLVGADGGRSFVRGALGVGFPGRSLGARAVVADVVLAGLSRDAWHRFNTADKEAQMALCPLAGTDLFQLQAPVPLEGEVDLSAAGLTAMVAARTGRQDIRIDAVEWASAYAMSARLADHYRRGRVLLMGDAAHTHPPTGGQGLNTSMQDAYNLGWKLAAVLEGASQALLDTYEEERRPIAADMLGMATRLLDAARQGDMRRGREVQQLDLGYRQSSLSRHAAERAGERLQAGDRAPDALLRGAAGQARRLFDVFRGAHWTLFGFEASASSFAPRSNLHIHRIGPSGDLRDEAGQVRAAYGLAAGDWVLVRPDGYIAAIRATGDAAAMEEHLRDLGLVAA
ncbi:FAD-dependent oxidoreductase [Stenotrophomonas tumulicola]|uniref:Alkyl hydroperoxide reductase subunit F n=1 Tax=Stenotrophomonas tumulicola TaxID=1685415 RepID=A0A7W3IG94_9GAMM|nr:FAD-dependent oxidoreductase [Stenotrophomonas tumulicola]MBA8680675.1 FAD-dependent oxidoreductase [Stenotrophomonas tumulicola]